MLYEDLKKQAETATREILEIAKLKKGSVLVVGCSSSEIGGKKIGTLRSIELAEAVFDGIYSELKKRGIFLAAQCCEHLNRALVVPLSLAEIKGLNIVNAVPVKNAGGSFATVAYKKLEKAVLVEEISADAGLDIGDTLIGMHLKKVAVPVRLSLKKIGEANLVAARTRFKFIGGERAVYNENLL